MQTIAKLVINVKPPLVRVSAVFLVLWSLTLAGHCQPGTLQPIDTYIEAGSLSLARFTPLAMSYYPYHNGQLNDSVKYILGDQLTAGTVQTADRILDVTSGGSYAYRNESGTWAGPLSILHNGHALVISNRHEARTITMLGYPADSITYMFPMPNGSIRFAAPRMAMDHPISSVGLSWSFFSRSQNMRQGGDMVFDMVTGQIARRDSTDGWIGTMTHMRVGQPVIIQVNYISTFDWTYNPFEE